MSLRVGLHEADIAQTLLVAQPASAGEPGRGDVYPQCAPRGRSPSRFARGLSRAAADVEDAVGGADVDSGPQILVVAAQFSVVVEQITLLARHR